MTEFDRSVMTFPNQPHTLSLIQGPLFIEGGVGTINRSVQPKAFCATSRASILPRECWVVVTQIIQKAVLYSLMAYIDADVNCRQVK